MTIHTFHLVFSLLKDLKPSCRPPEKWSKGFTLWEAGSWLGGPGWVKGCEFGSKKGPEALGLGALGGSGRCRKPWGPGWP